jgi:hypothetical protein
MIGDYGGILKMDMIFLVVGAMFLAYAGMIMLYYNIRSKEKKKRISKFMLDGVMSLRRGSNDKATTYFKIAYEYSEEINDYQNMAEAIYYMGLICKENEDIENAVYFFQEASNMYMKIEDYDGRYKALKAADSLEN